MRSCSRIAEMSRDFPGKREVLIILSVFPHPRVRGPLTLVLEIVVLIHPPEELRQS